MGVGSFAEQFEAIVEDPAASDAEFDASAVVSDLCAALEANGVQADEAELDGEAAARWAFDFTTGETVALAQALSESLRESGAYAYLGLDDMEAELASLPAVAIELGLEGELTCAESGAVALEGVMDFGGDVGRMPFSLAWDGADAGSLSLQLISGDLPSMEGQINADGEAWGDPLPRAGHGRARAAAADDGGGRRRPARHARRGRRRRARAHECDFGFRHDL